MTSAFRGIFTEDEDPMATILPSSMISVPLEIEFPVTGIISAP
jgi:hypothetical protein